MLVRLILVTSPETNSRKKNAEITFVSQPTFALEKKKKQEIQATAKHFASQKNAKNCIFTLTTI